MADDKVKSGVPEPQSVVIPLEDRGDFSRESSKSRKSSTSTSSFEDIDGKGPVTPRPVSGASFHSNRSQRSRHSVDSSHETDAATVEVGLIDKTDSPESRRMTSPLKGPSTFKTTSLEDPQFYAQTTSPTTSYKSSRANIHSANRKYGAREDDRDPENVNDIVKVTQY